MVCFSGAQFKDGGTVGFVAAKVCGGTSASTASGSPAARARPIGNKRTATGDKERVVRALLLLGSADEQRVVLWVSYGPRVHQISLRRSCPPG